MSQDGDQGDGAPLTAIAVGARVVDSIMGDLTGDGRNDALLVIELRPSAQSGASRTPEVALMQRDATGRLRKVATSGRLLTCGPYDRPFNYLRTEPGAFTIVNPGVDGAADDNYRFVYDKRGLEWIAASVLRLAADTGTGHIGRQELIAVDLGQVMFEHLDPGLLPLL